MENGSLAMLAGIGLAVAPVTLAAPANATPLMAAHHFSAGTRSNGFAERFFSEKTEAEG